MNTQTNKNTTKKDGTKFNTTISAFWENAAFGNGAFKSPPLNDKAKFAVEELLSYLEKGEQPALVLRPGIKDGQPLLTANGDQTYFLEILPPIDRNRNNGPNPCTSRTNEDDI